MIECLEPVSDATLRRVGPVHAAVRATVWAVSGLVARATPLDAAARPQGLARADLLKVDVEAVKSEVLAGISVKAVRADGAPPA